MILRSVCRIRCVMVSSDFSKSMPRCFLIFFCPLHMIKNTDEAFLFPCLWSLRRRGWTDRWFYLNLRWVREVIFLCVVDFCGICDWQVRFILFWYPKDLWVNFYCSVLHFVAKLGMNYFCFGFGFGGVVLFFDFLFFFLFWFFLFCLWFWFWGLLLLCCFCWLGWDIDCCWYIFIGLLFDFCVCCFLFLLLLFLFLVLFVPFLLWFLVG